MYPSKYIEYLLLFHLNRDYFECHEVMEEFWKKEGKGNSLWKGLIQLAVIFYHYRRNNFAGAKKLIRKATTYFHNCKEDVEKFGIDSNQLFQLLKETEEGILENKPYRPIAIPIVDEQLINICAFSDEQFPKLLVNPMENSDPFIVHKHLFRDR
ncbi:DUF309 domain-containing protein [Fervidibacillus albus]|uniref:DUF309 domain-containing protein n=1 Tax=Fervidibacillus albus TaxID=2980026 RepID=A0A9E8RWP5_9BACI|nr:DUF309 domain-containing protein [Fervidibacillus albus]WAA10514.1 DUF309 domain-containing protein [Fervidibacillus albus]